LSSSGPTHAANHITEFFNIYVGKQYIYLLCCKLHWRWQNRQFRERQLHIKCAVSW